MDQTDQSIDIITDEKKEELLENSPAPRVSKEQMDRRISSIQFTRMSGTVTICSIMLDNGFSVRGESACVNPENYNEDLGKKYSHDNAYSKLWAFFGFMLAEDNLRHKNKG